MEGDALHPDYCVDKLPHPVQVNVWGCFCARGMGYCYIFNDKLDKKKLKSIVSTHLKQSAALYYQTDPPEPYYVLQDNDPKHTSAVVRAWFHNAGITLLDFPPSLLP